MRRDWNAADVTLQLGQDRFIVPGARRRRVVCFGSQVQIGAAGEPARRDLEFTHVEGECLGRRSQGAHHAVDVGIEQRRP